MKNKLMLAAVIGLLSTGAASAFNNRRNGNCCDKGTRTTRRNNCGTCPKRKKACGTCPKRQACRKTCSTFKTEPVAPRCCKTILVDKVIQVEKTIDVPARRIEVAQPDRIEYIPQEPIKICTPQDPVIIPQPDIITYKCVEDKVVRHKVEPCIRFECPDDCN